jgi:phage-related protein
MPRRLDPIPLRFWKSATGGEPAREWLRALPSADKKAIGADISKVQYGWPIGMPLCRSLAGGLWELRSSLPSKREARVLFCFHEEMLIALHAFVKKRQKTPGAELALARQRMNEASI